MTTEKQRRANKANAQLSTGAKTEAGKAIVSGNAIRHGILSRRLILDGESSDDYSQLLDGLMESNALQNGRAILMRRKEILRIYIMDYIITMYANCLYQSENN